jgi:hypothetical protein
MVEGGEKAEQGPRGGGHGGAYEQRRWREGPIYTLSGSTGLCGPQVRKFKHFIFRNISLREIQFPERIPHAAALVT